MADPQLDELPENPVRGELPSNFSQKMNLYLAKLVVFSQQLAVLIPWMSSKVAEVSTTRSEVQPILDNMTEILAADDNAALATQKAGEAAASAASVDPSTTMHTVGSGLANESYSKAQVDASFPSKTSYATSTVGGVIKARVSGSTLFITTNGANA